MAINTSTVVASDIKVNKLISNITDFKDFNSGNGWIDTPFFQMRFGVIKRLEQENVYHYFDKAFTFGNIQYTSLVETDFNGGETYSYPLIYGTDKEKFRYRLLRDEAYRYGTYNYFVMAIGY